MTRVLLVGYDPNSVDFSDPALPPGLDAGKIQAGIEFGLRQMRERGWDADSCLVQPDQAAAAAVKRQLASSSYDCVVIGGGIRIPPRSLEIFEAIVNAIRKGAPGAAIAFNTQPEDSANAAARQLAAG